MALDMTPDQQAAKLLQQAQLLMNEGGKHWGKGSFRNSDGGYENYRYCAVGALREVLSPGATGVPTHNPIFRRAVVSLARIVNSSLPPKSGIDEALNAIYEWNDAPEREWGEVRKAFTRAIGAVNRSK